MFSVALDLNIDVLSMIWTSMKSFSWTTQENINVINAKELEIIRILCTDSPITRQLDRIVSLSPRLSPSATFHSFAATFLGATPDIQSNRTLDINYDQGKDFCAACTQLWLFFFPHHQLSILLRQCTFLGATPAYIVQPYAWYMIRRMLSALYSAVIIFLHHPFPLIPSIAAAIYNYLTG